MKGAAGTTGQTYGRPEDQTTPSTLATRAWSVSVSENVRMLTKPFINFIFLRYQFANDSPRVQKKRKKEKTTVLLGLCE